MNEAVSVHNAPLTLDSLHELPDHARRCIFWELDPTSALDTADMCDPEFEKEAWISTVMLQWGACGQMLSNGDRAVGYAIYAPPSDVPRSLLFPTSPVSPDAVLLTTMKIVEGAGAVDRLPLLLDSVVRDLVHRGVRALEAFGHKAPPDLEDDTQAAHLRQHPIAARYGECSTSRCMIAAEELTAMGFEVVAPHHRFPRLRLELDSDLGWKAGVESALERLIESASLTTSPSRVEPVPAMPIGVLGRSR